MLGLVVVGALTAFEIGHYTFSTARGATPAEDVYNRNCITCHGKNGGGASGPNLLERRLTRAAIEHQLRFPTGAMQQIQGKLADDEVRLAVDWVVELRRRAGRETPNQ